MISKLKNLNELLGFRLEFIKFHAINVVHYTIIAYLKH